MAHSCDIGGHRSCSDSHNTLCGWAFCPASRNNVVVRGDNLQFDRLIMSPRNENMQRGLVVCQMVGALASRIEFQQRADDSQTVRDST
jgi:hypothetical protein